MPVLDEVGDLNAARKNAEQLERRLHHDREARREWLRAVCCASFLVFLCACGHLDCVILLFYSRYLCVKICWVLERLVVSQSQEGGDMNRVISSTV